MIQKENNFRNRLENINISIFSLEKHIGRDENNDISAVAWVEWEFYTELREWGVKDICAYATNILVEFEVNWWNENDTEVKEEFSIDTSDDEWELETNTDNLEFGHCICPQDVEVDYETKIITIYF